MFEFEWGILRKEHPLQFYLVKSRKRKENLRFSKRILIGLVFKLSNQVLENQFNLSLKNISKKMSETSHLVTT
jgi:hypothetical protein